MSLWLVYSCNRGGTDKTTSYQPECDDNDGEQKQLDVRGCGGWIKLNCDGGSLDIQKVCTGSLIEHNSGLLSRQDPVSTMQMSVSPMDVIPAILLSIRSFSAW